MSSFDFSVGSKSVPTVTLLRYGIAFNEASIAALGKPEFITIGLDRENKTLAVKALDDNDKNSFCRYNFVNSDKKRQHVIISAAKLRNEIIRLTGMKPLKNEMKFLAYFEPTAKMLVVDLK